MMLLLVVGLVMLLSASYPSAYYNLDASIDTGGNPYYYFQRQLIFAVMGLVAMFIISKIDYQRYRWMSVLVLARPSCCCCWCSPRWGAGAAAPSGGSACSASASSRRRSPRWASSCFFPPGCPSGGTS